MFSTNQRWFKTLILSFIFVTWHSSASSNTLSQPTVLPHHVLRLPNLHTANNPIEAYAKNLLYQALKATEAQYGTFELKIAKQPISQERQMRSLEHDLLDIAWSVTSIQRETQHLPIRIPIMAGLFGKRLMLVRENDERFNVPISMTELRSMRAVLGYDWPDSRIFRHNEIPVIETTYRASFRFISEGFADIFPRSVMEIQTELRNLSSDNALKIAPNLLIEYDSPVFFFVSSKRPELAERITKGLLILLDSGEFQRMLSNLDVYQDSIELMNDRHVIKLENPSLSLQSKQALEQYLPRFN